MSENFTETAAENSAASGRVHFLDRGGPEPDGGSYFFVLLHSFACPFQTCGLAVRKPCTVRLSGIHSHSNSAKALTEVYLAPVNKVPHCGALWLRGGSESHLALSCAFFASSVTVPKRPRSPARRFATPLRYSPESGATRRATAPVGAGMPPPANQSDTGATTARHAVSTSSGPYPCWELPAPALSAPCR